MAHDVSADDLTLPAINSLVQVSVSGGDSYRSRVEDAGDGLVTVAAPLDLPVTDIPELGTPLAVRWGAGARGRYVLTGPLVEILTGTPPRWVMRPDGPPRIEQTREFVRGGGDAPISVRRVSPPGETFDGRVVDVSEGGVRARFAECDLTPGEQIFVTLHLGEDIVGLEGTVLRTWEEEDDECRRHAVLVFQPHERDARVIRRYVLQHQLRMRNGRRNR